MKGTSLSKIIIPLVAVFIAGAFLYNLFLGSSSVSEVSSTSVGNDLIDLRSELQEVTLDREIFLDQRFIELRDFSTDIPSQPTGRSNPFDVIGRE